MIDLTEKVRLRRDLEVAYPRRIIPKGAEGEIEEKGDHFWTIDFEEYGKTSHLDPEKFEEITELEIRVEEEYQKNFLEKIRDFLKL